MEYAERYALPTSAKLGQTFARQNDFKEVFYLRWGRIRFDVSWGSELNIKLILKVYRDDTVEQYVVDTDPTGTPQWNFHTRTTRDFFVHPFPKNHGRVKCVKFAYIVHLGERSIPSEYEYIFMDGHHFDNPQVQRRRISGEWATRNGFRTVELDAALLQRDVDHYNDHFDSLRVTPKFTRGKTDHPYHPKRFIHDHIDKVIWQRQHDPARPATIKVSVDCIDDTDFVNHLLHAHYCGVKVQCVVDWRKMMLTNSQNYARLKRAGIELLGVFCTPKHPSIEVAPDMHTKFIIFGDSDCILGSFNITFDRWGANWESGMTFHSQGVCRLLDNVFQSQRGGVIQRYGVDPLSQFNLLYTFGRQATLSGRYYRPHQAIISEIRRARFSIKLCLFLIGEMTGEHDDSVVDALIEAKQRGVDVRIIFNGHLARQGDPGKEVSIQEERQRPLLPAVDRLRRAGIPVALAYGVYDQPVPYSPLHAKYCIIDEQIVLEGSFNWYNTSVFSHDLLVVVANREVARPYLYEFGQILNRLRIY